jgi:hypothetical protein
MADKKISQLTNVTTPLAGTETIPVVQSGETRKVTVNNLTAGKPVSAATLTLTGVAAAPAQSLSSGGTTTAFNYWKISNTGADFWMGVEGSTGGDLFGGTSPYDAVTGTVNATNLHLAGGAAGLKLEHSTANVIVKTGNLVIGTAGKGIDFSADPSAAGMTSELLDDYEEGTWTPGQGSGLTVVGAFSSDGTYTKVGRQVTVTGYVAGATSVAVSAGGQLCTSVPFASGSTSAGAVAGLFTTGSSSILVGTNITCTEAIGASSFIFFSTTYSV